jgi:hypothetical protein
MCTMSAQVQRNIMQQRINASSWRSLDTIRATISNEV